MTRLEINAGETYTVNSGFTEEWTGSTVNGTLNVQGSLLLIDDPDTPTTEQPPESPSFTTLLNPDRLSIEFITLLAGLFLPLVYLAAKLRSAIIVFGITISLVILLLVILIDLAFIWFWIAVIITTLLSTLASIAAATR